MFLSLQTLYAAHVLYSMPDFLLILTFSAANYSLPNLVKKGAHVISGLAFSVMRYWKFVKNYQCFALVSTLSSNVLMNKIKDPTHPAETVE